MPSVVLNLHAHLPLRLKKYSFFDIGHSQDYFDGQESRQVLERVAKDSYLPVNACLLKLIRRYRGRFRVSCSVSGMLLEQLEKGQDAVLESFRRLADTGCVEFPAGPWHHSLASLFSEEEFRGQIALHRRKIRALFGQVPRTFRNTELIYGNDVARIAESMGFRVILAGGEGRLPGCDAEALHRPARCRKLKVLFRHDRLSDDLALRPAGAAGQAPADDEFVRRLADGYHGDEIINLFMDYETFGGHGQNETGIPGFLETLPGVLLKRRNWRFSTPSGAAAEHEPAGEIDVPGPIFPAGSEKVGLTWPGNLQVDAARTLYGLEDRVRATKSREHIGVWRNLQASDHFRHMSTENLASGAGQVASNPFASPYDAYIHTMNILKDFSGRIAGKTGVRP